MSTKSIFRSGNTLKICVSAILFVLISSAAIAKKPIRVVMIGGGTSHVWNWNFGTDSATLVKEGFATVKYVGSRMSGRGVPQTPYNTDSLTTKQILAAIKDADVLYITTNNQFNDPELRKALMDFVNSGKGMIFGHAGGWHNYGAKQGLARGAAPDPTWTPWTDYNTIFLNGGTRRHDALGNYEVNIVDAKHQISKGIARTTFPVKDELYNGMRDSVSASAPGWHIIASAKSPNTGITWPQVWTTNNPKGKLVNITLGHDAGSHDLPEFQTILRNSVAYAAGKKNPKK